MAENANITSAPKKSPALPAEVLRRAGPARDAELEAAYRRADSMVRAMRLTLSGDAFIEDQPGLFIHIDAATGRAVGANIRIRNSLMGAL